MKKVANIVSLIFMGIIFLLQFSAKSNPGYNIHPVISDIYPSTISINHKQEIFSGTALPEKDTILQLGSICLYIPEGAVDTPTEITVQKLRGVAPLPGTLENVTRGARGYRFEPHGIQFNIDITVSLPFSENCRGSEVKRENLSTCFYNELTQQWEKLKRLSIDTENLVIHSATNHFTDMVNTTLQMPEPRNL